MELALVGVKSLSLAQQSLGIGTWSAQNHQRAAVLQGVATPLPIEVEEFNIGAVALELGGRGFVGHAAHFLAGKALTDFL